MRKTRHWKGGGTINKKFIQRLKVIIAFLNDRKLLIGLGIGLIIGTLFAMASSYEVSLSKASIEKKARGYGMIYRDEVKVFFDKEVK